MTLRIIDNYKLGWQSKQKCIQRHNTRQFSWRKKKSHNMFCNKFFIGKTQYRKLWTSKIKEKLFSNPVKESNSLAKERGWSLALSSIMAMYNGKKH